MKKLSTNSKSTDSDEPSFDSDGAASIVDELYKEVLGRSADDQGLTNYVRHMQQGMTVLEVKQTLRCSAEYIVRQTPLRPTHYTDDDLSFFMGTYKDAERAEGALSRLRQHYPNAALQIRSDGDPDPANERLSKRFKANYTEGERLYPIENGGALVAKTFELFLRQPRAFFLKIDPDTSIDRRFDYLLDQVAVFGSLQHTRARLSVQGGFTGATRETVEKIVDSGLLLDPRLRNPKKYQDQSSYFRRMAMRSQRCGLSSFDWILGWASAELGIPILPFDEVHCRWKANINFSNDDLKFALTHPVYFEQLSK
ncbi:MAG: DUF4214 domain-containing protein [Arenicella sp.]|nr:DUF4214 domain-containing protein [Arenicella sp.]